MMKYFPKKLSCIRYIVLRHDYWKRFDMDDDECSRTTTPSRWRSSDTVFVERNTHRILVLVDWFLSRFVIVFEFWKNLQPAIAECNYCCGMQHVQLRSNCSLHYSNDCVLKSTEFQNVTSCWNWTCYVELQFKQVSRRGKRSWWEMIRWKFNSVARIPGKGGKSNNSLSISIHL